MLAAWRGSSTKFGGVPCHCHFGGLRIVFFCFFVVVQLTLSSLHISFRGAAAAGGISKKKKKDDTNLIGYEPKNMDDVVFIITVFFYC